MKMGTMGCPETPVINYHYSLHNKTEERRSQHPTWEMVTARLPPTAGRPRSHVVGLDSSV